MSELDKRGSRRYDATGMGPNLKSYWPQVALLAVTIIWGWTFVLVKEGASELGPLTFLALRFALALIVLLILFWGRLRRGQARAGLSLGRETLRAGLWIGLSLFFGYFFQTWGLLYTTATKSGFITGLSVVLVPLLSALAFGEPIPARGWLGAGLAALGLGLILFGQGEAEATETGLRLNLGDLLTLFCALSFALQVISIGRFVNPSNYPEILVIQIGIVFLLSLAGAFLLERPTLAISPKGWEAILITGFLATALAFFIQNRFQPLATATEAAIIFSAEPVFAGLFGYLLLGERLASLQLLGAAAILGGIVISQLPLSRRAQS
ncbi:MAG: DMT family transporter [Candidatus Bipolaricaulia bacterium]